MRRGQNFRCFLGAVVLACLCVSAHGQLTISLGNPPASVDVPNTDFASYTHLATSINLVGVANNIAVLTFPTVDITGFISLSMRAAITDTMAEPNPNVYALIEIFDSSLNVLAFDTFTNLYGTSPTDVVLTFNPLLSSPSFNFNDVVAFQFTGGGIGTQPLNITIYQLDVTLVPEPGLLAFVVVCVVAVLAYKKGRMAQIARRTSDRAA